MVAITAQMYGLNVSASRIVSFEPLSAETRRKHDAVVKIDAELISATVPGARAGEIVSSVKHLYSSLGFAEDFELHHQGGAMGYEVRYYCAPECDESIVQDRQAFSWNPTIAGVKSEDTCLILGDGQEVISRCGGWPQCEIEGRGKIIERPDILVK
jgi:Xaa-Pro aminopeptidase